MDFFECVAWRGTAENICKYFHKGDGIGIIGSLQTDTFQDKEGNNRKKVQIQVDSFEFLPGKKNVSGEEKPVEANTPIPEPSPFDTADLPF